MPQVHKSEQLSDYCIDRKLDPVTYHQKLCLSTDNFVCITLTTSLNEKIKVHSELFGVDDDCNEWGQEQLHCLEALFQVLHSLLITNDIQRRNINLDPANCKPTIKGIRSIALDDYSPLHQMTFMLGTGTTLGEINDGSINPEDDEMTTGVDAVDTSMKNKASTQQRATQICTSFAYTDMIWHLQSSSSGFVKPIVTLQLLAHNGSKGMYNVLNKVGVSLSYQTRQ